MDYNDSPNCAEYAVERKNEGCVRLLRLLLLLGYTAFAVGYIVLFCVVTQMLPLIAVLPLLLYILCLSTWRYVSYDVAYSFEAGTMVFRRVYGTRGRRIPREKLRLQVKDAEYVGLLSAPRTAEATEGVAAVYDFLSSASVPNAAVIVARDSTGRRIAVRFDCIRRVAKLMRVFCPRSELDPESFSV